MALKIEKPVNDPIWEIEKNKGNRYFVDKNYPKAVEAYSKAIEADPQISILYSNRAAAYLKMEKPLLALQDTEIGLEMDPSNVKLLYRKGKALIQLKKYDEAAKFLEEASRQYKDEKDFADLVSVSKRMRDEFNGNYDIVQMMEETKKSKLLVDHADYYALDKFEIKPVPTGQGLGLVATQKIEAGTLLMACKAFIFADGSGSDKAAGLVRKFKKDGKWYNLVDATGNCPALIRKTSEKLRHYPELADDFYKLYSGKELGRLEKADGENPVDVDRITAIVYLNAFTDTNRLPLDKTPPSENESIRSICKTPGGNDNMGIWIMPSHINHSCVDCNCFRYFVGDFMFIRATTTINPGEELLLAYIIPSTPYEQRRAAFLHFEIECKCRLCMADRNEPPEITQQRDEMMKLADEIEQPYKNAPLGYCNPRDVAVLKYLWESSTKYRPDNRLNFVADHIQKALFTVIYYDLLKYQQLIEEMFSFAESIGELNGALRFAKIMEMVSKEAAVKNKWVSTSKKLAKLLYGDERVADML